MEAVPQSVDDVPDANPSNIKNDNSSQHHESNSRESPPPNCAICLGMCQNKSFTDSCLHQFCFKCLVTWSKVKAECPLCKQSFKIIKYNVISSCQFEEYKVEERQNETVESVVIEALTSILFSYRTILTSQHNSLAVEDFLLQHYPQSSNALSLPSRSRSSASFRRIIYERNLRAQPLPDHTGRFRNCSPGYYRYNMFEIYRLVPWLNRELNYLLNENVSHISYVLMRILERLLLYDITSSQFREAMRRFFGERTEHFLHELHCFATSPYDMNGYDRNVQYTTESRALTMVNEVISTSESDGSIDTDVAMIPNSVAAEPPAGPSGVRRAPPRAALAAHAVMPIETIANSDTDDSSEVMVVGYIKPPKDRTPELVDLVGSDSDVVVEESSRAKSGPSDTRPTIPPVSKLKLKRSRAGGTELSDSDTDDSYQSPARRRRRPRISNSGMMASTHRTTPEPTSTASEYDTADELTPPS